MPVTPSNEEAPPVIAQPELPGFQQDPERPPKSLLRQQIEGFVEDAYADDGSILLADGYDEALIGFGAQFTNATCAIYDTDAVIALLTDRDGLTHEDAIEWFDFNIQGAWVGEHTPIFFHRFVPDPAWKPASPDLRVPGAVMVVPTDPAELAQSLSERLGPAAINEFITLLQRHTDEHQAGRPA